MYLAELRGKLPSDIEAAEDILTSNVFSFLKYTNRYVYLKAFLNSIRINVSNADLDNADFQFWPCYEDGTEPDVVIVVGQYYILIEAKLRSGFGEESKERAAQLKREADGGLAAANGLKKKFVLVAITADSTFNKWKVGVPEDIISKASFRWINWQSVAKILLNILSNKEAKVADKIFAADLLSLLDKKKLRGFQAFKPPLYNYRYTEKIFFSFETAKYRGRFIGFKQLLYHHVKVKSLCKTIFYSKQYFNKLNESPKIRNQVNKIFYDKGEF